MTIQLVIMNVTDGFVPATSSAYQPPPLRVVVSGTLVEFQPPIKPTYVGFIHQRRERSDGTSGVGRRPRGSHQGRTTDAWRVPGAEG